MLGCAGLLVAVDQAIKVLVARSLPVGASIAVLDHALWLTHVENRGIAFGMADGSSLAFSLAGVLCLGVLLAISRGRLLERASGAAGVTLLAGGALGNLVDRVTRGSVTDYIDLGFWPVFNFADACVTVGVAFLVVFYLGEFREEDGGVA